MAIGLPLGNIPLAAFNPIARMPDQPVMNWNIPDISGAFVTGLRAGTALGESIAKPIAAAIEYNSPEAKARREREKALEEADFYTKIGPALEAQQAYGLKPLNIPLNSFEKPSALTEVPNTSIEINPEISPISETDKFQNKVGAAIGEKLRNTISALENKRLESTNESEKENLGKMIEIMKRQSVASMKEGKPSYNEKIEAPKAAATISPKGDPYSGTAVGEIRPDGFVQRRNGYIFDPKTHKLTTWARENRSNKDVVQDTAVREATKRLVGAGINTEGMTASDILSKSSTMSTLDSEQVKTLNQLTDNYEKDDYIKKAKEAIGSRDVVTSSLNQKNGLADIAAINAFQRMVDPGATVREGDVSLIQSASAFLAKLNPAYLIKKLERGDKLPEETRKQMRDLSEKIYEMRALNANNLSIPKFKKIAEATRLPFDLVGQDFKIQNVSPQNPTGKIKKGQRVIQHGKMYEFDGQNFNEVE